MLTRKGSQIDNVPGIPIRLLNVILSRFALPNNSIHGITHWKRVEAIGRRLAASIEADVAVVSHFAYLHDSCRVNEDFDPEHGLRAKEYVLRLAKEHVLQLTSKQVNQLAQACEIHTDHRIKTDNLTIATCIDADRLDIVRLHLQPYEQFFLTFAAKKMAKQELVEDATLSINQ